MRLAKGIAAGLLLASMATALAAPKLAPVEPRYGYGQPVKLEIREVPGAVFIPATRYAVKGEAIDVELEYARDAFGPLRPDFTLLPQVSVGELLPGTYRVSAKLVDIATGQERVLSSTVTVDAPAAFGAYAYPKEPQAYSAWNVVVKSATWFDPRTLRASVAGDLVRVDFDYAADAPVTGPAPAGMVSVAAVSVVGLAPGGYRLEGWGRPLRGGLAERYFTSEMRVMPTTEVVEFYAPKLDHYFVTANADEIALLDADPARSWMRTGQSFKAWTRAADAPLGSAAVCRFYARGPNSHFYTASAAECDALKALEAAERARGGDFNGWAYEGIAFHTLAPSEGSCGALRKVYRAYNGRAKANDTNHRFTPDASLHLAMTLEWVDEGPAFCSPS